MNDSTINIAVVIPYFQRKPGILRRALNSVLAQDLPANVHVDVIIVDDQSPAPGSDEVADLPTAEPFRFLLIPQANGGVSAARNTGLSAVSEQVRYIAFLDSDDIWEPDRLRRGIEALESGYDFFFSDHGRKGMYASHLEKYCPDLVEAAQRALPRRYADISREDMLSHLLASFPTNASTVLYRREICPDLRFDSAIKTAGEDMLFFAQVVYKAKKLCFNADRLVECADGINMFFSQYCDWDSPVRIPIAYDRIATHQLLQNRIDLSPRNARTVRKLLSAYRRDLLFFAFRNYLKTRTWTPEIKAMARDIPWFPVLASFTGAGLAFSKLLGRYRPV